MRNLLLFILACAAGCSRPAPTPAPAAVAPPAVAVVKPEMRAVKRVVEQPGAVKAFEETVLYAKISGHVRTIAADPLKADRPPHDRTVDIGSRVRKDQLLVELSVPELEEEYKQKEATVRQGDAEVVQAKKALTAAGAGVTAAKAFVTETKAGLSRAQALYDFWQSEEAKFAKLVKGGVIDAQGQGATVNQFKAAEAGKAEAVAKVASAEAAVAKADADAAKAVADVTAIEAKLDVAKADVRRVDALRNHLLLKAPFDGILTRRAANTGDLVSADGKQGLFAVARIDPVRVVIHVPEADAGLVTEGQTVQLALPVAAGGSATGKVTRTSWSLEPGSRTLRVEVDLPNAESKVRPGMYVHALLTAELPAAWSVPAAAIARVNDEPVAYLVENGNAVRVFVQLASGDAQITQVRGYRKSATSQWEAVDGTVSFATPAANVADGQAVESKP